MGPKKKRKVILPDKPGICRQYLTAKFRSLPVLDSELQNGHILFIYISNNRSLISTVKAIADNKDVQNTVSTRQLNSLVNKTLNRYKNLSREAEMKKFDELCCRPFSPNHDILHENADYIPPNEETSHISPCSQESINQAEPIPSSSQEYTLLSTPPAKQPLRPTEFTPRCKKMKKRLDFVTTSSSKMRRKYMENIKSLKEKLRKPSKLKHLNQTIKRKQATIDRLRRQIQGSEIVKDLLETRKRLNLIQRKHRRLKEYRRKSKVVHVPMYEDFTNDEEVGELTEEIKSKDEVIKKLENEKVELEETVENLQNSTIFQREGKMFSSQMRMFVYDSVVNHVPTKSIPILIGKFAQRSGLKLNSVPHRSTVEMMTREMGVISDFLVGEVLIGQNNLTLGFDATTQEGLHVNAVHVTTSKECHVISVDQLPGGTAEDYDLHITESINRVAEVYSTFHKLDYETCRLEMIDHISNTITDRVTVNHATIKRLEETWGKSLNELNCHLHPLETIARTASSTLKEMEPETCKGKLFGKDCVASNIVLAMNKLRFKDGKGDPKGFVTFLDKEGLPRGLIPRYRGNRLHILFHICGKFIQYHDLFMKFLQSGGLSCGGLTSCLTSDFDLPVARLEMQVLGLIGKLLSGPWMTKFYTSAETQVSHIDGICVVQNVLDSLKTAAENPASVLTTRTDYFGNLLSESDETLLKLQAEPANKDMFSSMMKGCLSSTITVLERQYQRYFDTDITDKLRKETESARCHNIDAEEIMGMFSASKDHAPNATLCYLSSTIRAQKNKVGDYLDSLVPEKRKKLIQMSVTLGRKQRQTNRKKCTEIKSEISKRQARKREKKATTDRNKIEKKLKSQDLNISVEFPELDEKTQTEVSEILEGKVVGRQICHVWYDRDTQGKTLYSGKIEKLKKKGGGTYSIGYWSPTETYDDAVDFDIAKYALAADLICEDLTIS